MDDEVLIRDYISVIERVASEAEADFELKRSAEIVSDRSVLDRLYANLGLAGYNHAGFPTLYEQLVSTCRWQEVDLGEYRLLANPPGEGLNGLAAEMKKDQGLWETLCPNGYLPFGRGPDGDYNPVCFDFRHRQKNGDCRIVKLDHEEILCNYRIVEVAELAPNFKTLLLNTLRRFSLPT